MIGYIYIPVTVDEFDATVFSWVLKSTLLLRFLKSLKQALKAGLKKISLLQTLITRLTAKYLIKLLTSQTKRPAIKQTFEYLKIMHTKNNFCVK